MRMMKSGKLLAVLALVALVSVAWAEEAAETPRTGFFRKKTTPLELLGAEGAKTLAKVFAPDEKLEWQLYVPRGYDASKPAGVIVFINRWGNSGGSRKAYNALLDEKNLIWAGVLRAGDKTPMNERMMRALITPTMLAQEYALDPERVYIGGFSGGAHVATILATAKPAMFRGGLYVGGTVPWKDNKEPAAVELMRKNCYVFLGGSNDISLTTLQRTAKQYKGAGISDSKVIVMPNQRQEMPGPYHLREAIEYLDSPAGAGPGE